MKIMIDLPFPISTNRIWRAVGGRVIISAEYRRWKSAADAEWYAQKPRGPFPALGKFHIDIVLDASVRKLRDGENHIKCVLDWCQRAGLVHNDRDCDSGTWTWGAAPAGCRIILEGEPHAEDTVVQRAGRRERGRSRH